MAEGFRFARKLTGEELERVLGAARGREPERALVTLWDVILREAEGVSYQEAVDAGLVFDPPAYVIPRAQGEAVLAAMRRRRSERVRTRVGMLWFNIGPGSFEGDPPAAE